MNVRDLSPSLLAMSVLLDQINAAVNGPEKHVVTQYKAGKDGSFSAQLALEADWLLDPTAMFDSADNEGLQMLLDILWGDANTLRLKGYFS